MGIGLEVRTETLKPALLYTVVQIYKKIKASEIKNLFSNIFLREKISHFFQIYSVSIFRPKAFFKKKKTCNLNKITFCQPLQSHLFIFNDVTSRATSQRLFPYFSAKTSLKHC